MVRSLTAELGVSVTHHWKSPLPLSCLPPTLSSSPLTLPLTTLKAPLAVVPWGRTSTAPGGRPPCPRFCPQSPIPPPCLSSPTSGLPLLAAPVAPGAAVYTPEMALLKMTFNQSWNYHADGCKPRNQSRSRQARLAGASRPPFAARALRRPPI